VRYQKQLQFIPWTAQGYKFLFHKLQISRSIFEERIKLLNEGSDVFKLIAFCSWSNRVRNEEVLRSVKEDRNITQIIKRRTANSIGHILQRKCLLKQVNEGRREVTGRRGVRRTQLLDGLEETRRYWKLKEEGLDHKHSEELAFEEVWTCRKTDYGMTISLLSTVL
jgi:hypothetical protein